MVYLLCAIVLVVVLGLATLRRVRSDEGLVVSRRGQVVRVATSGLAMVIPGIEKARRVDLEPRRRWCVTTTVTSDGMTAHLRVQFLVTVADAGLAPENLDGSVLDAVEKRLADQVHSSTAAELPTVGDQLDWPKESLVSGVLVEEVTVTVCDIEAADELGRVYDWTAEH